MKTYTAVLRLNNPLRPKVGVNSVPSVKTHLPLLSQGPTLSGRRELLTVVGENVHLQQFPPNEARKDSLKFPPYCWNCRPGSGGGLLSMVGATKDRGVHFYYV